ncbi:MAG: biotin--[acetyl-CoA-carboxylase] ligase [Lutibacter sp.]|nr:biotin--[acetyl-CoA-carboxylase] ligase [Lutibacter sp.]MBP9601103.1 biotin--[acetyl-CoA-carboxylase] ligase [Lutibacter sp.]
MHIIKLNAIESTNSYLKDLLTENTLKNFLVVWAEEQTKGRGQLGATWVSDEGKNLTFSVLIKFKSFSLSEQFYLSMAVSLGVRKVLANYLPVPVHIKWPNDILAEKDKIAGILIENMIGGNNIKQSIIGIGLNVNQTNFPLGIGNPISIKNIIGINIDRNELLEKIIDAITYYIEKLEDANFTFLKTEYLKHLFKLNKPSVFSDKHDKLFLGKIIGVSEEGRLIVELENEKTREFNLKEIKFASR